MICGTGSFPRLEEEEEDHRHDRRRYSSVWSRHGNSKKRRNNPYSSRGLDKFYNVLADLEALRQKIALEKDNPVMFKYSGSHQWVPIVFKIEDPWTKKAKTYHGGDSLCKSPSENHTVPVKKPTTTRHEDVGKGKGWTKGSIGCSNWILFVMILLFLVLFGKTSSICLTTVCLYAVPAIRGQQIKKIDDDAKTTSYRRRTVSEKNLGSGVTFESFRPLPISGRKSQ